MPIIEMHLAEGRTPEQKRRVANAVTDAVIQALGVKREAVRVLITEHGNEEFYVAGETLAERAERQRVAALVEQGQ
ncbi:MAG TPA: 2-hydroxymuconate tautomerase family protein [Aromatoleum sp.]|uniref:Tautomerase n=2 Tax=Aromatoleum toluvorans TaxID=92002 RepID=A0ABX1PWW7_9RHOO|nr:2-hydroxymuconate tautomerase family protein [Aromatoleum sp.]NMG43843.1 2-hydroxymuconate tautomerase family protein [Aromatoleum toluvorans]HJV24550.1 2-hydroxymuconate tautomerase family protein [Aromatoleum sp.]